MKTFVAYFLLILSAPGLNAQDPSKELAAKPGSMAELYNKCIVQLPPDNSTTLTVLQALDMARCASYVRGALQTYSLFKPDCDLSERSVGELRDGFTQYIWNSRNFIPQEVLDAPPHYGLVYYMDTCFCGQNDEQKVVVCPRLPEGSQENGNS